MILTEEEAKTKWCPEVRTGLTVGMAVNHHVDMTPGGAGVHDETRCIGSACMAWRWHGYRVRNASGVGPVHPGTPGNLVEGCTAEYVGYCGKAGKP